MKISFSFICVCAVLINKVSLQLTVEGVIGGSVLLPCSTQHHLTLQDTYVHWRHNDSKIVFDIIKSEESVPEQNPRYKNRVESFPEEYQRGNFSIKLSGLTHADAGKYNCFITPSNEQETVELIINEQTTEKRNKTTDEENQEETRPDGVRKSWLWILFGIALIILVILFIIFRKKISSCFKSGERDVSSDTLEVVSPCSLYKSVTTDDGDHLQLKQENVT